MQTSNTLAKAPWNRDTERSFFARLTLRCTEIKNAPKPKDAYMRASKWLDRLYTAIDIPSRALAQADNRLLLALMHAEDRAH